MTKQKEKRKPVDWEAMAPAWRAGIVSVLQLSKEFGVSRAAIIKHWRNEGVERDLSEKISARADTLVTQAVVTPKVTPEQRVTEQSIIEVNAKMLADHILNQRDDVKRARAIVQKLWAAVESEIDYNEEFEKIGESLRSEDEFGQDKLNDAYCYAISLPQKVKSVKLLADALKVLIELERKILRVESMPDPVESAARGAAQGAAQGMNDFTRSALADLKRELEDEATAS